jgi:putative component of toxin-antitoxin plasmid stabilization module
MLDIKQTDTYRKWELLCGGDKDSQQRDIETAHRLAAEREEL